MMGQESLLVAIIYTFDVLRVSVIKYESLVGTFVTVCLVVAIGGSVVVKNHPCKRIITLR